MLGMRGLKNFFLQGEVCALKMQTDEGYDALRSLKSLRLKRSLE